jgi:hypothetical protein
MLSTANNQQLAVSIGGPPGSGVTFIGPRYTGPNGLATSGIIVRRSEIGDVIEGEVWSYAYNSLGGGMISADIFCIKPPSNC